MNVTLSDLFAPNELAHVKQLYYVCRGTGLHRRLCEEVVRPALARIDAVTGQANDADYLAYMLEAACNQALAHHEED